MRNSNVRAFSFPFKQKQHSWTCSLSHAASNFSLKIQLGNSLSIFVSMITSVLSRRSLNHIATERRHGWEVFWSSQKLNVIGHVYWLVYPWFRFMWDHRTHMTSHEFTWIRVYICCWGWQGVWNYQSNWGSCKLIRINFLPALEHIMN